MFFLVKFKLDWAIPIINLVSFVEKLSRKSAVEITLTLKYDYAILKF